MPGTVLGSGEAAGERDNGQVNKSVPATDKCHGDDKTNNVLLTDGGNRLRQSGQGRFF